MQQLRLMASICCHLGDTVEGVGEAGVSKRLHARQWLPQRQHRHRRDAHQPVGLQVADVNVEVGAPW
jgi:hypothetical protein